MKLSVDGPTWTVQSKPSIGLAFEPARLLRLSLAHDASSVATAPDVDSVVRGDHSQAYRLSWTISATSSTGDAVAPRWARASRSAVRASPKSVSPQASSMSTTNTTCTLRAAAMAVAEIPRSVPPHRVASSRGTALAPVRPTVISTALGGVPRAVNAGVGAVSSQVPQVMVGASGAAPAIALRAAAVAAMASPAVVVPSRRAACSAASAVASAVASA